MRVAEAQREVRTVFMGGFPGQLVSGVIWLASAALATWGSRRQAILMLVMGGAFIFPLAVLLLRAMRRRASLSPENPLGGLAMQVAFTIPLSLPVIGAAALARIEWFYPAFMVVVGAHYLPFVFLYGMAPFAVLAAVLIGAGVAIGLKMPGEFAFGGWFTGVTLIVFAIAFRALAARGERRLVAGG